MWGAVLGYVLSLQKEPDVPLLGCVNDVGN